MLLLSFRRLLFRGYGGGRCVRGGEEYAESVEYAEYEYAEEYAEGAEESEPSETCYRHFDEYMQEGEVEDK